MRCASCGKVCGILFQLCQRCSNAERAANLSDSRRSTVLSTSYGLWAVATVVLYFLCYPAAPIVNVIALRRGADYEGLTYQRIPYGFVLKFFYVFFFLVPFCLLASLVPVLLFYPFESKGVSNSWEFLIAFGPPFLFSMLIFIPMIIIGLCIARSRGW